MNLRSWGQWVALPWTQGSVAVALVGALALPALLLSSGPMFQVSASDEIATRVIDRLDPGPAGLVVQAEGPFDEDRLGGLADELEAHLVSIDGLGSPARTLLSDKVAVTAVDGVSLVVPPGLARCG
ncbi:MAG: hypothetical protein R2706_11545 [Acidimicrobiales bacterium]